MAMNSTDSIANDFEDEGKVDLAGKLKSSLNELGRVRMKYKALKEELVRERQGFEETIAKLELQLEVSRRDEDSLTKQLQEREQIIE